MNAKSRKALRLAPGEVVSAEGKYFKISEVLDFESVIATDLESGRNKSLRISDLATIQDENGLFRDIHTIDESEWKTAEARYAAIKPLLEHAHAGRQEVEERAKEMGIHFTTLYRWLRLHRESGTLDALMSEKRGTKKGTKHISNDAEKIIKEAIDKVFLTVQRRSVQKVVQEVRHQCFEQGITEIPHANTIRRRVAAISERERLRKRGYKELAGNKFTPVPGRFPNADYPLAFVQIDHTPVDIILVDDIYRKPIERPWITVAIDVYSRMVTGYYLSFDAPSATSVAMCVAHSILPKEEWLQLHGVDTTWPSWGIMDVIHVDNGSDFRSESFRQACVMNDIRIDYRPVRVPRFGGHIERYLGTLMKEIHDIPGTTFSSIKDKDGYDSEKNAVLTKTEFEKCLVKLICQIYHKNKHSAIDMPPEKKWEIGIFGNSEINGRGMPRLPGNRTALLLDFLPMFRRTIQAYGVSIDGLTYYADVLRQWINAQDTDNKQKKREFIFRRDPRDISEIWFFDPDLKEYFRIPFADQALPTMSVWEYQKARSHAKKDGMKNINEHQILRAVSEIRDLVDDASEKSKKARRSSQRRKEHEKKISPATPLANKPMQTPAAQQTPFNGLIDGDIKPFGDIK